MTTYPAISIHQPWASFIAHGIKRTEGRTHGRFASLVGQRVAIHATKTWDKNWREKVPEALLESVVIPWLAKQANLTPEQWARFDYGDFMPRTFPQGAVIATGRITTAFNVMNDGPRCTIRRKMPNSTLNRNDTCFKSRLETMQLTRIESGAWLYRFEDVQRLETPVKVAGRQGIWRVEL